MGELGEEQRSDRSQVHIQGDVILLNAVILSSSDSFVSYRLQKRLFLDPPVNYNDPVEVDLVYHQSVTDLFEQKIPLTKEDAVSRVTSNLSV